MARQWNVLGHDLDLCGFEPESAGTSNADTVLEEGRFARNIHHDLVRRPVRVVPVPKSMRSSRRRSKTSPCPPGIPHLPNPSCAQAEPARDGHPRL